MTHLLDDRDRARVEIDVTASEAEQLAEAQCGVGREVDEGPVARIDRQRELEGMTVLIPA